MLRLTDFGGPLLDDLKAGRTVRFNEIGTPPYARGDLAALAAIGIQAGLSVPLLVGGRFVVNLNVHQHEPRAWTNAEVALVEEVAERTWAALQRARAEAALRENEERQAFLLTLSDALRPLTDALEIQETATRLLGEHLVVRAVNYGLVETVDGVDYYVIDRAYVAPGRRSTLGRWPVTDFPGFTVAMRAGETIAVDDVASAPNLMPRDKAGLALTDTAAFLMLPLVKNERPTAMLCVVEDRPRAWTSAETALLQEVAERTWAAVERARAETALRESEERLRQFGEASQDVLWIRDAETLQWTYLTPAFEMIYGLSRHEALSGDNYRSWLDLIVPEDRERAADNIGRVRAGEHVTFEYRIRRPRDGAIRWLRNTDFPILDDTGNVELIGGIGHDATELREVELRLRALVEGMPQLVWRAVDGGEWTWASSQWTGYTGLTQSESAGWGWIEALHPEDRGVAREAWSHAIERGRLDVEYRLCRQQDDTFRWFQSRAAPVSDEAGTIVEWLGTSTDVHDLRELQERQKVLVAELQHRTRNLMGVVRSTSDKTARSSADLKDFRGRFRDRLDALARAQGLLSRLNNHDRVTFDELIQTELTAMNGDAERVRLDGPEGVRLLIGVE